MKSLKTECGEKLRVSALAVSVLLSGSVAAVGQQAYTPGQSDRPYNSQPYDSDHTQFHDGFRQGSGGFGQGFNPPPGDRFHGDPHYDDHRGGIGVGGGAGIGAAGGAVLGAAFGGGIKGTLIGGAVGAGIGAAIASAAKNKHHDFKHH